MAKTKNMDAIVPELSPEDLAKIEAKKAEVKEKAKAAKEAQREAMAKILAMATASGDADLIALAKGIQLVPKTRERTARTATIKIAGQPRATPREIILDMIGPTGEKHEDAVWAEFHLGRVEMKWRIADAIKKSEPADRPWVSFDPETGLYKYEGAGELPPEDFNGFVPENLRKGVIEAVDTNAPSV
jgi:hypothetical protein